MVLVRTRSRANRLAVYGGLVLALFAGVFHTASAADSSSFPPAPAPEPVHITKLPLPPRPDADGICHSPTGCVTSGQAGGFLPNSKIVSAMFVFEGAPADPAWSSDFAGHQIVLIKTDGSVFPTGEPWKCITCGIPEENKVGAAAYGEEPYPQPFRDGRRILAGTNIIDCAPYKLDHPRCVPAQTRENPIYMPGTSMRELRLHPDNVHLGFNVLSLTPVPGQWSFLGRLRLNPSPTEGTPLAPRYELNNVHGFFGSQGGHAWVRRDPSDPSGKTLKVEGQGSVGEFRGFTGDGKALLGMCWAESNNTDICATDLQTGKSERVTADPAYIDPVAVSPDNNWTIALESRHNDRFHYIAGLRGLPPINQLSTGAAGAMSAGYKIGAFRLFQPFLLDRHPTRPDYDGQQLNACQPPETQATPNSVCDPNWGTRADPRWSPDGTRVVYGQTQAAAPDCLGYPPLGCPTYTEEGGHTFRIMVAELTSRDPKPAPDLEDLLVPDEVPWGTPMPPFTVTTPGGQSNIVNEKQLPPGVYTLPGRHSGEVTVTVGQQTLAVSALYENYSEDGRNFYSGTESLTSSFVTATFHSALVLMDAEGNVRGGRFTSPGGFTISVVSGFTGYMKSAGLMTTVIDGRHYLPPTAAR